MPYRSVTQSRWYDVLPLWSVPLSVVAIAAIFWVGTALGVLGVLVALAVVAWLVPKVDAYVRRRDTGS